jgi:hypothetical protein
MRDGSAICCSLDTESYAKEASRLWGFCDGDAMEVSVEKSGRLMALDFPDFSAFLASFSVVVVASLKALAVAFVASLTALSVAFLASLVLWLRILFLSFYGSNARSTSVTSSSMSTWSNPSPAPLESTLS